jgi:hypothetical protein
MSTDSQNSPGTFPYSYSTQIGQQGATPNRGGGNKISRRKTYKTQSSPPPGIYLNTAKDTHPGVPICAHQSATAPLSSTKQLIRFLTHQYSQRRSGSQTLRPNTPGRRDSDRQPSMQDTRCRGPIRTHKLGHRCLCTRPHRTHCWSRRRRLWPWTGWLWWRCLSHQQ